MSAIVIYTCETGTRIVMDQETETATFLAKGRGTCTVTFSQLVDLLASHGLHRATE